MLWTAWGWGPGVQVGIFKPLKNPYPQCKWVYLRQQKYALYFAVERQLYNKLIVNQSAKCNSIHDIHFFGLNLFFQGIKYYFKNWK